MLQVLKDRIQVLLGVKLLFLLVNFLTGESKFLFSELQYFLFLVLLLRVEWLALRQALEYNLFQRRRRYQLRFAIFEVSVLEYPK